MKTLTTLICSTLVLAGITACGSDDSSTPAEVTPSSAALSAQNPTSSEEDDAAPLALHNGWVRATDKNMTGVFGTIVNSTDKDITLVDGAADIAGALEMHQVLDVDGENVMQKVSEGHTIGAHSELLLEPGADHIMLMQLREPIKAGDDVSFTLRDANGSSYEFTASARESAIEEGPYHSHEDGADGTTHGEDMGAAPSHDGHQTSGSHMTESSDSSASDTPDTAADATKEHGGH